MSGTEREERDIEGAVAVYRRLPRTEPPAELDAAVLAHALRAVARPSRARWPFALASAAVVMLAVGLGWRVGRESLPAQPASPAPAGERAKRPEAFEGEQRAKDASDRSQSPAREADSDDARLADEIAKSVSAAPGTPEAAAAAGPVAGGASEDRRANASTAPVGATTTAPIPVSEPAPAAPPAELSAVLGRADAPARSGAVAAEKKEAPVVIEELEQARDEAPVAFDETAAAAEPAPAPAPAPSPPPPPPPQPQSQSQPQLPGSMKSAPPEARPEPGLDVGGFAQPEGRDAERQRVAPDRKLDGAAADRELAEVRRLVRERKIELARKRLRDWRRTYPDLPVPDDLEYLTR